MPEFTLSDCESKVQFEACIIGNSLTINNFEPKEWPKCNIYKDGSDDYRQCVYDGYQNIIECFEKYCDGDKSHQVAKLRKNQAKFKVGNFIDDINVFKGSDATTNTISKIAIGFLAATAIIMNFL